MAGECEEFLELIRSTWPTWLGVENIGLFSATDVCGLLGLNPKPYIGLFSATNVRGLLGLNPKPYIGS